MPKRLHQSGNGNTKVPVNAVYIGKAVNIKAVKGKTSNWPGEWFIHKFKHGQVYKGTFKKPAGSTLIYTQCQSISTSEGVIKVRGKIYGLPNGNVLVAGKYLLVANRPLWDVFNYPER
jgi:hypothetical protein